MTPMSNVFYPSLLSPNSSWKCSPIYVIPWPNLPNVIGANATLTQANNPNNLCEDISFGSSLPKNQRESLIEWISAQNYRIWSSLNNRGGTILIDLGCSVRVSKWVQSQILKCHVRCEIREDTMVVVTFASQCMLCPKYWRLKRRYNY